MLADENAADTLRTPEPASRRAYWPVALLLGGLVLAMLGGAFVLDQEFRPRVGVEPASVAVTSAQPAAVAPTIASAAPISLQPTSAPTGAATPTAAPTRQPTTVPTAQPSAVSTAVAPVAAAAAAGGPPPKSAAELLTPLQKEVIDAYLRYWVVRIRAYYDLDTSHLGEVMAEAELAREEEGVRELRAEGRGADIDIEHNFRVVKANDNDAVVYDEYVNHSVFIDAVTKQVIPTKEPPGVLKISFQMRKIDGTWKVVDGARHD